MDEELILKSGRYYFPYLEWSADEEYEDTFVGQLGEAIKVELLLGDEEEPYTASLYFREAGSEPNWCQSSFQGLSYESPAAALEDLAEEWKPAWERIRPTTFPGTVPRGCSEPEAD